MTGGDSHRCGAEASPWRAGDRRRTRVRPLLGLRRTRLRIDTAAQDSLRRFRGALAAAVVAEEEEERLPAETDSGRLAGVRAHDCGSEHWGSGSLRARPERRPAATPGR